MVLANMSPKKSSTRRGVRQPLLRVEDAADALGLSPKTLRDWITQRRIGIVRLGGAVRISQNEIERLIEVGTQPARRSSK
jgi:excisionase family DNA binding protein